MGVAEQGHQGPSYRKGKQMIHVYTQLDSKPLKMQIETTDLEEALNHVYQFAEDLNRDIAADMLKDARFDVERGRDWETSTDGFDEHTGRDYTFRILLQVTS